MAAKQRTGGLDRRSISIRSVQLVVACVTLLISVLLLVATFTAKTGYTRLRENTDNYIQWERDAKDLQIASDYLTEQARCFVVTGKRNYLDSYFEEVNVSRRRETALQNIHAFLGDSPAFLSLQAAMEESVALMDREYYAMRLAVAAFGYDYTEFPEAIQRVELSEEDALLSPQRQAETARSKVFDDVYHQRKQVITENVLSCLATLADDIGQQQTRTANGLNDVLSRQRLLILAAIGVTLLMLLVTMLLVVSPLLRAVVYIRADEPIPIKGSKEFQFLARTYNLMYESNREQKEHLAFEATHDALTGVYNRNGYDFILKNTDWDTSCLLLFDVDKFKPINDTYGHEMGDRMLKQVAKSIRDSFRSQDYVCRIGGDEFAVIMGHTDPSHANLVRGKVRRINEALAAAASDGIPLTHVSCGAAYGGESRSYETIFETADAALYRVKNRGGGGCEVAA